MWGYRQTGDRKVLLSTMRACFREDWIGVVDSGKASVTTLGKEWLAKLDEGDFLPKPPKLGYQATDILKALRKRHSNPPKKWVFIEELRLGTGWSRWHMGSHMVKGEQRIDAVAFNTWSRLEIIAYEIKISRGDFLHEVKNPEKRRSAMLLCDYFTFVVPKGLVKREETPEGCGLMTVDDMGRTLMELAGDKNPDAPRELHRRFVASMLRNVAQRSLVDLRSGGIMSGEWEEPL